VEELTAAAAPGANRALRLAALRTLSDARGQLAERALLAAVQDPDEALQATARNSLRRVGYRGAGVDIAPFTASREPLVRAICAEGCRLRLPDTGYPQLYFDGTQCLVRLLADADEDVRAVAAQAVGQALAFYHLVGPLARGLEDASPRVQVACAGALVAHLSVQPMRSAERKGMKGAPTLGPSDAVYKFLTESGRLCMRRGDRRMEVAHLFLAFAVSDDPAVRGVLVKRGMNADGLRLAAELDLGRPDVAAQRVKGVEMGEEQAAACPTIDGDGAVVPWRPRPAIPPYSDKPFEVSMGISGLLWRGLPLLSAEVSFEQLWDHLSKLVSMDADSYESPAICACLGLANRRPDQRHTRCRKCDGRCPG
jgi:hypothetical protein